MEKYADPIILQIIGIIVAATCGWLGAQYTRMRKKDEALYNGMAVLLRANIAEAYDKYVIQQRPLTMEAKREIDETHDAYAGLGQNSTGTQMYAEICERPIARI